MSRKLLALFVLPLGLSACAGSVWNHSPTAIYYKDGQPAHIASCERESWKGCLELAGEQCKAAGYTVLEKHVAYGYDGRNELLFRCNGSPEPKADAKPAASAQ